MGKKIILELPEQFDMDEKELLVMLAAHLYGDRRLSMGRAAALVGMGKREFMESLGKYGVSVFNYGPDELENDVKHASGGHQ